MRWVANLLLVAAMGTAPAALGAERAKPPVTFELVTRPGLPLTASQQWYKALTGLGISGLQIRAAQPGDEADIHQQGSKAAPQYKVVGILTADNVLHVPGGTFKPGDVGRLRTWLDKLGDEGAEGVTARRTAFGFTPRQLGEVTDDLKRPVTFSTKGLSAAKAVERIGKSLKLPLELDETARSELARVKVADELSGITSGTALAALLRPAGLVLRPERPRGGELRYRVEKAQKDRESWPVGWKPSSAASKPLPELFEFLQVEIKETSVSDALDAIQGRLKAPFLFDRNAMALYGIDPATVQAEVPDKRMTYSQILGKVLMQARLKYELRLDEADKPFLWITSVKPAA